MNICGFGGHTKQKSLLSLFLSLNLDMIFIYETMCNYYHALHLFSKLKPGWEFCAIDSSGLFVGLLTRWNPLVVHCKSFASYTGILMKVRFKGLSDEISILSCYGGLLDLPNIHFFPPFGGSL